MLIIVCCYTCISCLFIRMASTPMVFFVQFSVYGESQFPLELLLLKNPQDEWLVWGGEDRNWAISKWEITTLYIYGYGYGGGCCDATVRIKRATNGTERNALDIHCLFLYFIQFWSLHLISSIVLEFASFVKQRASECIDKHQFQRQKISILNIINVYDYYIIMMKMWLLVVVSFFFSHLFGARVLSEYCLIV